MADPSLSQFLTNPTSTVIPPNPVLQGTAGAAQALQNGQPSQAPQAAQQATNVPAPPGDPNSLIPGASNGQVSPEMQARLMAGMTPGAQPSPAPADATQPGVPPTAPPVSQSPTAPPGQTHLSQVRGPFGTKGVLGDVLGHVMDIFLVNAGLKPEYTQRVQQAKYADALGDFENDPQGAVNRLSQAGYIDQAQTLQNNLVHQQYETVEEQKDRQDMIIKQLTKPADLAKAASAGAQTFFSQASTATPRNAVAMNAMIRKRVSQIDPDLLTGFPDPKDYPDPKDLAKEMNNWSLSGMSVGTKYAADQRATYQQGELGARQQGLNIQQQSVNQSGANMASEAAARSQEAADRAQAAKDRAANQASEAALRKQQINESQARERLTRSKLPAPGLYGPDASGNYWEVKSDGSRVPAHPPHKSIVDSIKSIF